MPENGLEIKEELNEILLKKAKGYNSFEIVEEFALQDNELKLSKRKVTTKNVAPDLSAIKMLLFNSAEYDLENMTDEQLETEKNRLLNMIKGEEDEVRKG